MRTNNLQRGSLLLQVLVVGSIGIILLWSLVGLVRVDILSARHYLAREQAFHLAEAGIEYYRWHLAHAPTDFEDGVGEPGPYVHDYYDKDGDLLGAFSLEIEPPLLGSTVVTITSTGVGAESNLSRSIEARLAISSLAKYAFISNSAVRYGAGTEVFGPIHSNDGIRFDGLAHNLVTSAKDKYDDPDHSGGLEYAVHTHVSPTDPLPPTALPARPDVFAAGRTFPVPAIDFNWFTADISQMKTDAQADGLYFAASGALGYNLVLSTNDTFQLYQVDSLVSPPSGCSSVGSQSGWGTWSVNNQTLLGNYNFPNNGLIFLEDNVWVEGQINTARLSIISARFPEDPGTNTSITINKNLRYTNYDGQDVLALIAQKNINAGLVSNNTLTVDAGLVAKNGRAGRYYYGNNCSPYHQRDTITLFGMIASNQRYGFAYTNGTGYGIRNIIYDGNLLYSPPPSFPLTTDQYEVISWREL
ncbi:MAG: hypothetical protein COV09_00635 [Candidatus Vogelbacteria bacterium CG10_big_fil_rev_8_21_14_0_10_50_13]|uniref:Type 4 fimbrial biogenesis protein PilX N-terminal domain-containing protein n=1 Tax=Candidatus Vogelbacteria bacterium CG10_big_fil_rev_8_21_14_0_10_50_13 TaxID=1975044 RepID=A0A2H0RGE8_9BACT|nr:MAG: hypothetical protein COV09_00635 [Candidatus Vogelbacteria bacterium CG10_big_fil_rev_8_21_14_0_10_50_13]